MLQWSIAKKKCQWHLHCTYTFNALQAIAESTYQKSQEEQVDSSTSCDFWYILSAIAWRALKVSVQPEDCQMCCKQQIAVAKPFVGG